MGPVHQQHQRCQHVQKMEEYEGYFAELSLKVARLKISLRIKRQYHNSAEEPSHHRDLHGEENRTFSVSSSLQDLTTSRRSSVSSIDSGISSSFSRSRRNSLSMGKNVDQSNSDCSVVADDEFERYFQPSKYQVQYPVPKFLIIDHDTSDDYSEVFLNTEGTIILSDTSDDQDTPPPLPPKNLTVIPPCLPPY